MSRKGSDSFLPPELILSIVDHIIPQPDSQHVALRASHPATKALLSLARVSIFIYPTARRLLYTHCLWIDDAERLRCLVASLTLPPSGLNNKPLFIRPYVPVVEHMSSLYLSYTQVSEPDPADLLERLFYAISPFLRHLVVDLPLRHYVDSDDDDAENELFETQAMLRHAFCQLTMLETFCSVRDELFLPKPHLRPVVTDFSVWPFWPNLKTLALYNPDVRVAEFWTELGKLKYFETLVLTRSDGLMDIDMKRAWRSHCGDEKRGLKIVLVNVESLHSEVAGRQGWKEDEISVMELNVPTSYYGDEDEIELCQEWVKRRVLRGIKPADWD